MNRNNINTKKMTFFLPTPFNSFGFGFSIEIITIVCVTKCKICSNIEQINICFKFSHLNSK